MESHNLETTFDECLVISRVDKDQVLLGKVDPEEGPCRRFRGLSFPPLCKSYYCLVIPHRSNGSFRHYVNIGGSLRGVGDPLSV